jgi:hypothetical protein
MVKPIVLLFLFFFLGELSLTHLLQSTFLCLGNTAWAPPWSWPFPSSGFLPPEFCVTHFSVLAKFSVTRLFVLAEFYVTRLSVLAEFSVTQLFMLAEFSITRLSVLTT